MGYSTQEEELRQAREIGVELVRRPFVAWAWVEPVRTEPPTYKWVVHERLENDLRQASAAGMHIMLPVLFTPQWAQAVPGSSCGPILDDRMDEFAQFLEAAVARYSQPPFNVKYWELYNEPDVDPSLVAPNSVFGCWGDAADPHYGGKSYARMLQHAYPAIKRADPGALVVFGGLLLDAPEGDMAHFLPGVLAGGGGDYFDILAFHTYAYYDPRIHNWDTPEGGKWTSWGGALAGKVSFLRQALAAYGYDKPLVLNETGLIWWPDEPASPEYRRAQADYVVQVYTRGRALGLTSVVWYGWREPDWHHMELLNRGLSPYPAYTAYANVSRQIASAEYLGPTNYPGIEGYRFRRGNSILEIVWPEDGQAHEISMPARRFRDATLPGGMLPATRQAGDRVLVMCDRPVYLALAP